VVNYGRARQAADDNTGCPTNYQTQQFSNNFTTDTFRHIQT